MVIDSSYRPLESDDYYSRIQHSQSFHQTFFNNKNCNDPSIRNLPRANFIERGISGLCNILYVGEKICW